MKKKHKFSDLYLDDYDFSDWFVPPLEGDETVSTMLLL